MTKSATSEAISRSWRAISGRATKKVLTLAKPRPEPRRSSMARRSKTWTRGAENWGNSPSRLSGGSRLQSFLSSFFGASHLLPVIFIFCELVLWIFFYLKSKRLFTFNGSNLHLIINFTMLIWTFLVIAYIILFLLYVLFSQRFVVHFKLKFVLCINQNWKWQKNCWEMFSCHMFS